MYDTNPYPWTAAEEAEARAHEDGWDDVERDDVMAANGWDDEGFWAPERATEMRLPTFVYGTLRPGHGNDRLWHGLATARYDGTARVIGYRLTGRGFPYMVPAASAQTVGTLIYPHVDCYAQVQAAMDSLEGVPAHYLREMVAVLIPDGVVMAWTYVPAPNTMRRAVSLPDVPGNDWANVS